MTLNPNWPLVVWQACFSQGANAGLTPRVWDDIGKDRVLSWSAKYGKSFELNVPETGQANVELLNSDEWLNPVNPSSPWNSGGKALKAYRPLRGFGQWPLTGNLIGAVNDVWVAPFTTGSLADTASFEGGTVGTWGAVAGATVASSAVRAHDGTKSMLITWATSAGGSGVAEVAAYSVPLAAGVQYTASAWVWLGSGPAVTLNVNGFTGTSTTTTGAWQRITVTFVAAGGVTTDLRLYSAGATTSGQQVWVDSVQVEIASTASGWTTTGPTVYPIHTGYIERYPETWKRQGFDGRSTLTSVDALGFLARVTCQDALTQEQLQDSPAFAWPLNDPTDYNHATNAAPAALSGSVLSLVGMGHPTGQTTKFGGSNGPSVDNETTLEFTPTTASDTYVAALDWAGTLGATVGGGGTGWTVEAWVRSTKVTRQECFLRVFGAGFEETKARFTAGGLVQVVRRDAAGSTTTTLTTPGRHDDAAWHHIVTTQSVTAGTVTETLWLDGQQVATATRSAATTGVMRGIYLGGDFWAGTDAFQGALARVAVYQGALSASRVRSHWQTARAGYGGELVGQRIARVLSWVGWKGRAVIPNGAARVGPASQMSNATATAACGLAATTERGSFLADTSGKLTLVTRAAVQTQTTPKVVFGEDSLGGEVPYLGDPQAELSPEFVYNLVKITRAGGSTQVASDPTSRDDYGVRSCEVQTQHATDDDAQKMAAFILAQYKDAHLRVPAVTVDPSANPGLWSTVLGLKFGDRVRWKRRTAAGLTVVVEGFIGSVEHKVTPTQWLTTYLILPLDTFTPGIVGDATYGVVGSTLIPTY